jgi:hypothetical protein
MTFESVHDATRLWIKGREFTVARLLGDTFRDQAEKYSGGALAIFRLAPQDYHRFHSPVDGRIGAMTYISGEFYTVNVGVFSVKIVCAPYALHCSLRQSGVLSTSTARTPEKLFPSIVLGLVTL